MTQRLDFPWGGPKIGTLIDASSIKSVVSARSPDLNRVFSGHANVISVTTNVPILKNIGEYCVSEALTESVNDERELVFKEQRNNEIHAIVLDGTNYHSDAVEVEYQTTDYATIRALRKHDAKPAILSACGFFVCTAEDSIILHKRSSFVDTYKRCTHIFGGNYMAGCGHNRDEDIPTTVSREFKEEAKIDVKHLPTYPFVIATEVTGFVQFVLPPFNVTSAEMAQMRGSAEGDIHKIPWDGLQACLQHTSQWVPSGLMHVLTWLLSGTPAIRDGEMSAAFDPTKATQMANAVLSAIDPRDLRHE